MSSIFIIHSSKDNEIATEISQWLKEHGHRSLFLDFDPEKGIPPGRDWEQELNSQLRASQAVIVLCSQHSMSSVWCFSEITQAKALGKNIFPIKVTPCTISSLLTSHQVLDIIQDKDIAYERLDERLTAVAEQDNTILHGIYGRKDTDESINVENKKQNRQKPPLSLGRIAGEILAGTVLCIVALLVVWQICILHFGRDDYTGSVGQLHALGSLVMFICLFPPLYVLGSVISVYLVGRLGKQTGSFLLTLGCGFLGGLVMVLMFFCICVGGDKMTKIEKIYIWSLFLLIGPIMATLGFNLTRRYK